MKSAEVWTAIDSAFAAAIRVIEQKSRGNGAAAAISLEDCNTTLVDATRLLQTYITQLRTQQDHTESVAINRVLQSYLVPLVAALLQCMQISPNSGLQASRPTAQSHSPRLSSQILESIADQDRKLLSDNDALALLNDQLSHLRRFDALGLIQGLESLAASYEAGVASSIYFLREIAKQRHDLLPALGAYLQEVGRLSNDANSVEIRPGISVGIGDIGSVHARILLALRYLEIKENFNL